MASPNPTPSSAPSPPILFIFDQLRTRSHLFHRFLSTHPSFTPTRHPWIPSAFLGPERHTQHTHNSPARSHENNTAMLPWYGTDTYASSAADFSTLVAEANKDGKILLANEHGLNVLKQDLMLAIGRGETLPDVGANPTAIPNSLYQQLQPLILIRNPLLQVPSSYTVSLRANQMRPGDEDFHNTTTLRFSRYLYDHFTSQGRQPIVVDGEDVLWRTKEVAEAVCGRLGLSAEGVRDVWEPSEMEGYGLGQPMIRAYMADILDSRGVVRPDVKPEEPTLESEVPKWKERWGDEVAGQLSEIAERNLGDYEYLRQFKV